MSNRRVVVTGVGLVCPVGNNVPDAWANAVAGKSGISKIESFESADLPVQIAGEVRGFDAAAAMGGVKEARRASTFIAYAIGAAAEAMADSGLSADSMDPRRLGVSIGVGMGSLADIEHNAYRLKEKGYKGVTAFFVPQSIPNMASGYVSIAHGAQGPNICTTTACTSGTHGIGEAYSMIKMGRADAMICGGAEAATTPLSIAGFANMRALTKNFADEPHRASRPFDKDRAGFVIAEGSGVMILESLEQAKARGARIYAEVVGYGTSADAHHITSPSPDGAGAINCMIQAIEGSNLALSDFDYINAHGTSTPINDASETNAIKSVFGDDARRLSISSTKSVTGHLLGGAGGVEGVFTSLAIFNGVIPPTINLETPDPDCDLDYTPNQARERTINAALSNSFGFGGTNGTLAFAAFKG